MNFKSNAKTILALMAVFAVVASSVTAAAGAGSLGMNPDANQYPKTYFHEDKLTIESHNRTAMGWLQYEGDNGTVQDIDAHVNGTESGAKISYRADQIEADALGQFPRVSEEDGNNSVTWLKTGNWSTTASTLSVTDSDDATAEGVPSIQIGTDGSYGASSSESASYSVDISDDVEKRYLQLVMNVDDLEANAELAVQIRDGNGDYVAAVVNSSRDATATDVIANQTASGVVYQEQLGKLSVAGSGDGSLDAIEEVRVVVSDGDANATITGLNVQKKSRWDFGEDRVADSTTDADDDYTGETVYSRAEGGRINAADFMTLGSTFDDATFHKLQYTNVEYRMQDKPSAASVEFPEAKNYPSYPYLLDVSYRRTIETGYDISHGNIELRTNQSFLSERYTQLRYAEGVGDTETSNISESDWIDLSGSLGEQGKLITADSTVQSDTTYVIEFESKLQQGQYDALQPQTGGGGFWGGGGGSNPFTSFYNWVAGGIAGLLGMVGIGKARS